MSMTINGANSNTNIYMERISNDNSLKDALNKFQGSSFEDLEAMGCKRMTPISKEEEEALMAEGRIRDAQPVFVDMDSDKFMKFVHMQSISWLSDKMVVFLDREIFTSQELRECYEVLQKADKFITKGSLDYKDYAAMGIAANVVKNYANDNLNQRQAKVIGKAIDTYIDSIVQAEQERYGKDNYFRSDDPYYNLRKTPDENDIRLYEAMLKGALQMPNGAGDVLAENLRASMQEGHSSRELSVATNEGLINAVYSLFAQVDLKDTDAVNNAFNIYRQLVAPAYASKQVSNTKGEEDSLRIKLSNAKAILINSEKKVDYSV